MSRKGPEGADLLVILTYADGRKEMVHYRGEAQHFREYRREPIVSKAAQPQAGGGAGGSAPR